MAAVPVSGIAVLQQLGVERLRHFAQVYALDTDSTKSFHTFYRATGLFDQGHMLSAYLMVIVLLGVAVLLDGTSEILPRRAVFLVFAAAGAGMAAVQRRRRFRGAGRVGAPRLAVRAFGSHCA